MYRHTYMGSCDFVKKIHMLHTVSSEKWPSFPTGSETAGYSIGKGFFPLYTQTFLAVSSQLAKIYFLFTKRTV